MRGTSCSYSKSFIVICFLQVIYDHHSDLKCHGVVKDEDPDLSVFNLFQTVDKSVSVHMELSGGFGNVWLFKKKRLTVAISSGSSVFGMRTEDIQTESSHSETGRR